MDTIQQFLHENGLEFFGVVLTVEYFKYYIFGGARTVTANHRALLPIIIEWILLKRLSTTFARLIKIFSFQQ